MKKFIFLAMAGLATVAVAAPAMARPHNGGYERRYQNDGYRDRDYRYQGNYTPGIASYTDRDGDGYDDRDTNYNGYIDPWEASGSRGYRGNPNATATDRNGDGYDDRDSNFNGYIDPWERDGYRGR